MHEDSAQKIAGKIVQQTRLADLLVLEVGCGDGRITSMLAVQPKSLVAIDPDMNQIRHASSAVSTADFIVARGECLPFPAGSFDLVLFTLSLHHQNSRIALSEAARVLKGDGRILVVEPAEDGEVEQFFTLVHDEKEAKVQAQRAIRESELTLERSETVMAQWHFDDRDELCRSLFDYYDLPFDDDTAQKITERLGAIQDSRPIVLNDTLLVQSLKKPE